MKKPLRNSRGQVTVLYAGICAILIGAIALGADVAVMYANWQQMQKTADAAALAGANYLGGYTFAGTAASGCTGQPDDASKAACTYAVDNGLAAANLTITEPTSSTIQVVAQETSLPYFFGKALGLNTYNVSATAIAHATGPSGTVTQGVFPVGLQCTAPCNLSSLDPGQSVRSVRSLSAVSLRVTGSFSTVDRAAIPRWLPQSRTARQPLSQSAAQFSPSPATKAIRVR